MHASFSLPRLSFLPRTSHQKQRLQISIQINALKRLPVFKGVPIMWFLRGKPPTRCGVEAKYPTELTTSSCKVIVTQRESIQIFKPHTLKAQKPSVISPLIRASRFVLASQSVPNRPIQRHRKQSYLVLPGNRNSLASITNQREKSSSDI